MSEREKRVREREGKKEEVGETNSRSSSISLNRIIVELNNSSCSEEVLVNDTHRHREREGKGNDGMKERKRRSKAYHVTQCQP